MCFVNKAANESAVKKKAPLGTSIDGPPGADGDSGGASPRTKLKKLSAKELATKGSEVEFMLRKPMANNDDVLFALAEAEVSGGLSPVG
jgi:hypothetical protein